MSNQSSQRLSANTTCTCLSSCERTKLHVFIRPEKQWHSFPKNIGHQNSFELHCPTTFCPIQHHPAVSTTVLYYTCPAQARLSGNVPHCPAFSCIVLHWPVLSFIEPSCNVLHCCSCTVLHCPLPHASSCNVLHCHALYFIEPSCTVLHCCSVLCCTVRSLLQHLAMAFTDIHCPSFNRPAVSCTVAPVLCCTVHSLLHHLAVSCTGMSCTVLHCPFCPAQPGTVLNCNKRKYEVSLDIPHRTFLECLFFD